MHLVVRTDDTYSPDVELDENGKVVFTRDLPAGAVISIPAHMLARVMRQKKPDPAE